MEKEVEVNWNGKKETILLSSVTYGDYKNIRRKSVITVTENGKEIQRRDMDLYDELFIIKSIKSAPFELIIENIKKLDLKDGLLLEKTVDEINFPDGK